MQPGSLAAHHEHVYTPLPKAEKSGSSSHTYGGGIGGDCGTGGLGGSDGGGSDGGGSVGGDGDGVCGNVRAQTGQRLKDRGVVPLVQGRGRPAGVRHACALTAGTMSSSESSDSECTQTGCD